jgi:hypothetical protein
LIETVGHAGVSIIHVDGAGGRLPSSKSETPALAKQNPSTKNARGMGLDNRIGAGMRIESLAIGRD